MIGTNPNRNPLLNQKCHIIGIGIDKYKNPNFKTLINCKNDVNRFIDTMCQSFETFSHYRVIRLFDDRATKQNIKNDIVHKLNSLNYQQNLIIYFAGHGQVSGGKRYLVPNDSKTNYKNPDKSPLISSDDILDWIKNKDFGHIVLIIDACHAGNLFNDRASIDLDGKTSWSEFLDREVGKEDFEKLKQHKSVWAITSGSDDEKVYDGDENGSPFSQILGRVLNGAEKTGKTLSIGGIGEVLKNRTPSDLKEKFKLKTTPSTYNLSKKLGFSSSIGEFVFEPNKRVRNEIEIKEEQKIIIPKSEVQETQLTIETQGNETKLTFSSKKPISEPKMQIEQPLINIDPKPQSKNFYFIIIIGAILLLGKVLLIPKNNESIYTVDREQFDNPKISATEEQLNPFKDLVIKIPFIDSNSLSSKSKKEEKLIAKEKPTLRAKHVFSSIKIDKSKIYDDKNTFSDRPNLVFVGSFENKSNAEDILERIKNIGYENAEIIMKEDLPYAVVVTGFYQFKSSAKAEVKALRKKGIEVYYSNVELSSIYRKKE